MAGQEGGTWGVTDMEDRGRMGRDGMGRRKRMSDRGNDCLCIELKVKIRQTGHMEK